MADINWEPYISTRAHKASQSLPQITIAKDNGRIALNSAACGNQFQIFIHINLLKFIVDPLMENSKKFVCNSPTKKLLKAFLFPGKNIKETIQMEQLYTQNH